MVTAGIFPFKENSHGRAGNRTGDLIISSQRLWPLHHEAGHCLIVYDLETSKRGNIGFICSVAPQNKDIILISE